MALLAIGNVMPQHQREKIVDNVGVPSSTERVVTFDAIGAETRPGMVRLFRVCIIIIVATEAIITDAVETQISFRLMTFNAIQITVRSDQWKPILFVQFSNVIHEPVLRGVTTRAIIAHRHAMHISMTGNALGRRSLKNQRGMTTFAIVERVGSFQPEVCGVMVE